MIILQKETIQEHNPKWPEILGYLYWLLLIGGSGYGKTNVLLHELDTDKVYLYAKDPYKAK